MYHSDKLIPDEACVLLYNITIIHITNYPYIDDTASLTRRIGTNVKINLSVYEERHI